MKIATWNIERPKEKSKNNQTIIDYLGEMNADIVILTETNENIQLGDNYDCYHSSKLEASYYSEGERRVSIYSKYGLIKRFDTFRIDTSICVQLNTPYGELAIYGTVVGIYGNRHKSFIEDLDQQLLDFDKIAKMGNICIGGDLNMSFSDNYYFTTGGRRKLNTSFNKLNLLNLTASIPDNIDHIIVTKTFIGERNFKTETWNIDKKLSDHIGVAVDIF